MIKVSVMYPNGPDAHLDEDYYVHRHMPMVGQLLGPVLQGASVDVGVATPQGPPPYLLIAHLWFETLEAFESALAAHGPALMADIPNYTNVRPIFQVSAVRLAAEPTTVHAAP